MSATQGNREDSTKLPWQRFETAEREWSKLGVQGQMLQTPNFRNCKIGSCCINVASEIISIDHICNFTIKNSCTLYFSISLTILDYFI